MGCGLDPTGLRYFPVKGIRKYVNEPLSSTRTEKFLRKLVAVGLSQITLYREAS
jgi:hypothetical protein